MRKHIGIILTIIMFVPFGTYSRSFRNIQVYIQDCSTIKLRRNELGRHKEIGKNSYKILTYHNSSIDSAQQPKSLKILMLILYSKAVLLLNKAKQEAAIEYTLIKGLVNNEDTASVRGYMQINENELKPVSTLRPFYQHDTTKLLLQETIFRQEKVIERLSKQNKLFFVFVALFLFFIVIIIIKLRKNEYRKREVLTIQYTNDIASLRMENARNRLGPHFMFNVLTSIMKDGAHPKEMEASLKTFSTLLQSNLANIDALAISLKQELVFIRDYIKLDNLRFDSQIEYNEEVTRDVDMEMKIPTMCIHILVENAIKHGLRTKNGEKKLTVLIEKKESKFLISVKDNGVGRRLKKEAQGTGTGTKILERFMELLNQNNILKAKLRYIDLVNETGEVTGTLAQLELPNNFNIEIR